MSRDQHDVGDKIRLRIRQEGKDPGQGIGYLPDGTMVMADGAGHLVGQETDVVLVRRLATPSGYIFFGCLKDSR
jgi:uncharacterized protein YacL